MMRAPISNLQVFAKLYFHSALSHKDAKIDLSSANGCLR